jgi:cytochrome c oxidase cbb3-type subunit III
MTESRKSSARISNRKLGVVRFAVFSVTLFFLTALNAKLDSQEKNPFAGDAKAIKLGEFQFRSNCAFCHGLGARGGGRGPDLTRAKKRHGSTDAEMFHNIHEGIAGTAMPAAVGSIGVGMTDQEVWQVIAYLRSIQAGANTQPSGEAKRGKEVFLGASGCSMCHMINGQGGRLGPDLSGTGSARSTEYIVDSIRNPSRRLAQGLTEPTKEFSQEYETVTVVTGEGQKYLGVVLNEDQFTLQMLDTREQLHLLEKAKLKSFEKNRESLMPAYDQKRLSAKDVQDLVAYLQEVSGQ